MERPGHYRRLVHTFNNPDHWNYTTPRPKIVKDTGNTDYLPNDVPAGTIIEVGGLHLGVCVTDHLLALARRQPVIDGRAIVVLNRSATKSWHSEDDEIGHCTLSEFEDVVARVKRETGIEIKIVDQ